MRHPRLIAALAAVVVIAVVAVVAVVALTRPGTSTYRFALRGAPRTEITLAGPAPTVALAATPKQTELLRGVRLLGRAQHIVGSTTDASIRVSYDPAALPKHSDPRRDLALFTRVDAVDGWLPVGGTVDTAAHTLTISTPHFSYWVLGVTDPDELVQDQALQKQLDTTTGRAVAAIFGDAPDALSCDAKRLLVPSQGKSDMTLGIRLCEQVGDDGRYELKWVNTTGLPVRFPTVAGFDAETEDDLNAKLRSLLSTQPGAEVLPGKTLTVRFKGESVGDTTTFVGSVDWRLWLMGVLESAVNAAVGTRTGESKVGDALADLSLTKSVADCVDSQLAQFLAAKSVSDGAKSVIKHCTKTVIDVAWEATKYGFKKAKKNLAKAITWRIDAVLAIPDLLEVAQGEIVGAPALVAAKWGSFDDTVSLQPGRFLLSSEALALIPDAPAGDAAPACRTLGTRHLPPGMPAADLCATVTEADLDGDRAPDRLISWHPNHDFFAFGSADLKQSGAVAYLADGTFHLLEPSASTWRLTNGGSANSFYVSGVPHLADDRSQQVTVTVTIGSSTLWDVVLQLTKDHHLRIVHEQGVGADTPMLLPSGSAAAYSSTWGCVRKDGEPLLATGGADATSASFDRFDWTRRYLRVGDGVVTAVGDAHGTATTKSPAYAGFGSCDAPDPATRGRAITEF